VILVSQNGASFFQFENLKKFPEIHHGIFTRHFGHSTGPFQSLNVSHGLGDGHDNVRKNRQRISQAMGGQDLVFVEQVHNDQVLIFDAQNSETYVGTERVFGIGDALVTNVYQKYLTTQLADCQSILFYDPIQRVIANVHSGWRGSIKNIIGRTVAVMKKHFKCSAADIIAGIGPSLGPCCAEFINYRKEIPQLFWHYKSSADHFDFWAISRDQLIDAGILGQNIEIGNICTKCNTETFFSHRGEGQTGRFAAVIGLNQIDSLKV
jgi:YfiH family protein